MWIVPKNYTQFSASALDTVASSEDLSLPGLNIESSLMWRSKPSPLRTWLQRWKRDSWFRHLSGRILKPCQHTALESALTYSLAVIPASPLAQPGNAKAQKTQDTCGPTSTTTYEQLDLFDAFLKTSRDTSASDYEKLSKTWKALVTKRRGEYSARLKSARHTSGSASLSWATPCARDHHPNGMKEGSKVDLGNQVRMWLTPMVQGSKHSGLNPSKNGKRDLLVNQVQWPTPTVQDSDKATKKMRSYHQNSLTAAAHTTWPTPSARDHKGGYQGGRIRNGKISRDTLDVAVQHSDNQRQSAGQLNPTWVEWLMGLPLGWTDLGFWGTE